MRAIDYNYYFWQDDKVRLRAIKEEDWGGHYINLFDSEARRLLETAIELPPTPNEAQQFVEKFKDFANQQKRLMFAIDTLDGEHVGALNMNSIDECNGTFSMVYK